MRLTGAASEQLKGRQGLRKACVCTAGDSRTGVWPGALTPALLAQLWPWGVTHDSHKSEGRPGCPALPRSLPAHGALRQECSPSQALGRMGPPGLPAACDTTRGGNEPRPWPPSPAPPRCGVGVCGVCGMWRVGSSRLSAPAPPWLQEANPPPPQVLAGGTGGVPHALWEGPGLCRDVRVAVELVTLGPGVGCL